MDAATFDRFLVLLDKHWAQPRCMEQTATDLHEWREAEARRTGGPPPRRISGKNLTDLCYRALHRLPTA